MDKKGLKQKEERQTTRACQQHLNVRKICFYIKLLFSANFMYLLLLKSSYCVSPWHKFAAAVKSQWNLLWGKRGSQAKTQKSHQMETEKHFQWHQELNFSINYIFFLGGGGLFFQTCENTCGEKWYCNWNNIVQTWEECRDDTEEKELFQLGLVCLNKMSMIHIDPRQGHVYYTRCVCWLRTLL